MVRSIPLSDVELELVSVSATDAQAEAQALGSRQPAQYSQVGFTYLGRWVPPPQVHAQRPDPISAYVAQLFGNPSPLFPDGDSGFMVVDAKTGEALVWVGPCWGRDCGYAPAEG